MIRFVAILQQAPLKGISHRHAAPAVMTWKQPEAPHSSPPASTHPRSGLLQNLSSTERLSCVQVRSKCTHQTFTGLEDLSKTILLLNTLSCTATLSIGILLILLGLILLVAWRINPSNYRFIYVYSFGILIGQTSQLKKKNYKNRGKLYKTV